MPERIKKKFRGGGGAVVIGVDNLSSPVGIGLTDLLNFRGPLVPPVPTSLDYIIQNQVMRFPNQISETQITKGLFKQLGLGAMMTNNVRVLTEDVYNYQAFSSLMIQKQSSFHHSCILLKVSEESDATSRQANDLDFIQKKTDKAKFLFKNMAIFLPIQLCLPI